MQKPAAVGHGFTELQRSVFPNKGESQNRQELFSVLVQILTARRNAAVAGVSDQAARPETIVYDAPIGILLGLVELHRPAPCRS